MDDSDYGSLPHLEEDGVSEEPVTDRPPYLDGGAAAVYLEIRDYEKDLARQLRVPRMDGIKSFSGEIKQLMTRWDQYTNMLGGEHFGPVEVYGRRRVVILGDATNEILPAEGIEGLAKLLDENPSDNPLDEETTERYKRYHNFIAPW